MVAAAGGRLPDDTDQLTFKTLRTLAAAVFAVPRSRSAGSRAE